LHLDRSCRLYAIKNGGDLSLVTEKYQNNPFEFWKKHLNDKKFVVASIPFVRNLAEYCGWVPEFSKLTSLLHYKSDSAAIKIVDLETIYKRILQDVTAIALPDSNMSVITLIHETAETIIPEENAAAELESKVILSIAIRLQAEEFMVGKINDQNFVDAIIKNQTKQLLERYTANFPGETESIKLLNQVNLMTPENLHLNSFMYEPIIDMAPGHLKLLYRDVKQLNA